MAVHSYMFAAKMTIILILHDMGVCLIKNNLLNPSNGVIFDKTLK
jgi:hypothetical protein